MRGCVQTQLNSGEIMRKVISGSIAVATAVLLAAAGSIAAVGGTPSSTPTYSLTNVTFSGVAAISADDVWVVGNRAARHSVVEIRHWDGSTWTRFPIRATHNWEVLSSIAATPGGDLWAVGRQSKANLIEHWTGSEWVAVPGPSHQGEANYGLLAVSADSDSDVWAAGYNAVQGGYVEHFDGNAWTDSGGSLAGVQLSAITAVAADDVWAVGSDARDGIGDKTKTFIEHFDGTSWSQVESQNPGGHGNELLGVTALDASHALTVGHRGIGIAGSPLAERWEGTSWSTSKTSDPKWGGALFAVAALSTIDAWTVGLSRSKIGNQRNLIQHLDGTRWQTVRSPASSLDSPYLSAVSFDSPSDGWAVGTGRNVHGIEIGQILHWDGTSWTYA